MHELISIKSSHKLLPVSVCILKCFQFRPWVQFLALLIFFGVNFEVAEINQQRCWLEENLHKRLKNIHLGLLVLNSGKLVLEQVKWLLVESWFLFHFFGMSVFKPKYKHNSDRAQLHQHEIWMQLFTLTTHLSLTEVTNVFNIHDNYFVKFSLFFITLQDK